ncbi:uncharacterized protein HRG_09018 [Hirsutella rhossiliensis]|uniref:YMC020W-like alpha/beta hydrolase domain-containing protein n=1 Tax=Hirsutella rhossiliensis TaxID=111463 RepID=A0A9P8MVM2_9HYPO|nr:uncharacterized protein HRG_09018 [Hirsutella rhossiliensis]KAH0959997.1 hypothetical protein HRG_09018 [Hirsutella rhossiliensis]
MLPRKRQRPNPAGAAGSCSLPTTALSREFATSQGASASHQPPPTPLLRSHRSIAALSARSNEKQVRKAKSWYGSWPRAPNKAWASTSVARENILGGTLRAARASDLSRFEPKKGDDAVSMLSACTALPLPGVPENAMTTDENDQRDVKPPSSERAGKNASGDAKLRVLWLGWWSRTPVAEDQAESSANCALPEAENDTDVPRQPVLIPPEQTAPDDASTVSAPASAPTYASTSWFGFWSSSSDAKPPPEASAEDATAEGGAEDTVMTDAAPAAAPPAPSLPQKREPAPKAGSTWAFWSRESPKAGSEVATSEAGEIAVMGEGSEARPQPMAEGDVSGSRSRGQKADPKAKLGRKTTWRRADIASEPEPELNATPATPRTETPTEGAGDAAAAATKLPPNLVLPCFTSTYEMKENPSILRQITNFLLRTSQPAANHVLRVKDTPRIRKALAIGVHGLIPATYLRPMIGQPTGTSLRFASLGADAIRRWADAHGCADCDIEKVALEGEGRIGERVDNLWKLMLNWIDHIRRADLIVVASHSQGVPVSIMLLEKLIELGLITDAKIGVCAMAGVALGPFPDYRSSILMGSAAELWDFGNPQSAISLRFETALKRILDYGARVTFIGSIDDQLVPMESAVYSPASHPYIYRAVFIDGRIHAPDFIAHLVGFALKLRNLGISDHGLIRELSAPLAGSLYSGEGHSRLYYDDAVYDLAVAHTLETSAVPRGVPCQMRPHAGAAADGGGGAGLLASPNPYVLPWIMRGVLEEDFVKTELGAETEELLRQFDDWRPTTKALRDVKYRLEAVRSKL